MSLVAARLRLQELQRVRRQVVDLDSVDASSGNGAAAQRDLKRGLLAIKFADLSAEVAHALDEAPPAEEEAAGRLRAALELEALRAQDAFGPMPSQAPPGPLEAPSADPPSPHPTAGPRAESQPSWRRSMSLSVGAGAAVIGLALALALGPNLARTPGAAEVPGAPGVEGQIAAGRPSQTPEPTPSHLDSTETVPVTFDAVVTGKMPSGWTVAGGTAGVVPFPNPVDRSLRIFASGETASACSRAEIDGAGRLSMDVLRGERSAVTVSIGEGDGAASLVVRRNGVVRAQPGGPVLGTRVAPGKWHEVGFELTLASGEPIIAVILGSRDVGEVERVTIPGSALEQNGPHRLCVLVRATSRGDVHVDNLVIDR